MLAEWDPSFSLLFVPHWVELKWTIECLKKAKRTTKSSLREPLQLPASLTHAGFLHPRFRAIALLRGRPGLMQHRVNTVQKYALISHKYGDKSVVFCCSVPRVLKFQFIRFTNQVSAQLRWEQKLTEQNLRCSARWVSAVGWDLFSKHSFPFDLVSVHNCTLLKPSMSWDASRWCSLSSSGAACEFCLKHADVFKSAPPVYSGL